MNDQQSSGQQKQELLSSTSLLIEIGTEEIPARFLPPAIAGLKEIAAKIFDEYRIGCNNIYAYATPRRLSLIIAGVDQAQRDEFREVFGPSKKVAFDETGNPSKAAVGFAHSVGLDVSDLKIKMKGKAEYIAAVIIMSSYPEPEYPP